MKMDSIAAESSFHACQFWSTYMRTMWSGFACLVHVTAVESERDTRPAQFEPSNLTQPEFLKMYKSRRNERRGRWGEGAAKGLEKEN